MNSKIKIIVAIVIYVAMAYYLTSTIILPLYRQGEELSRTLSEKKQELDYLQFLDKNLPRLEAEEIKVTNRLNQLREVLFPEVIVEQIFLEIYNAAQRGQVKISNISLGGIEAEGENSKLSVNINISGTYLTLQDFLSELEVFPYIVSVNRLGVSGREGTISANLEMVIYHQVAR